MKPTLADYVERLKDKTYVECKETIHMWVRHNKIDANMMHELCIIVMRN